MEARGERPMGNRNAVFVGCDLGDKQSEICVMDGVGAVIEAKRVRTTKPALVQALRKYWKRARRGAAEEAANAALGGARDPASGVVGAPTSFARRGGGAA